MFIQKIFSISPQEISVNKTAGFVLTELQPHFSSTLKASDPDYSELISLNDQRRMCKLTKMGVYSTLSCISDKTNHQLDAIIIGNGLNMFESTRVFLEALLQKKERGLPPTPFIQSLQSKIAGQIALELKFDGYTMSYSQSGFSFENSLTDAKLLMIEGNTGNILLGALDELTPEYTALMTELGRLKMETTSPTRLEESDTTGVMLGEGCVFMTLSPVSDNQSLACIEDFKQLYKPSCSELTQEIQQLLLEHGLHSKDLNLILLGNCGDQLLDEKINQTHKILFHNDAKKSFFKNYCGEYPTASAFAVWMATLWITNYHSDMAMSANSSVKNVEDTDLKVLIINHYNDIYYSVMLVSNTFRK